MFFKFDKNQNEITPDNSNYPSILQENFIIIKDIINNDLYLSILSVIDAKISSKDTKFESEIFQNLIPKLTIRPLDDSELSKLTDEKKTIVKSSLDKNQVEFEKLNDHINYLNNLLLQKIYNFRKKESIHSIDDLLTAYENNPLSFETNSVLDTMQLIFRNVEKSLLEFLVGDYVTSYGLNDIHTMFEGFDFINDIKDAASQIAAENDEGSYVEREFKLIDPDRETAKYAKKNITAIDNNYPINQIKFGLFLEMYTLKKTKKMIINFYHLRKWKEMIFCLKM